MKKRFKLLSGTALLFSMGGFVNLVSAQGFLPEPIQNLLDLLGPGGTGTAEFVQSRISALLLIFLGIIILLAVVYTAFAALRYIRSQGDEGEVTEARKGIEAIFQGIAVMLIAIVGIVLIFVFFGAELFSPSLYQTCVAAANSQGCNACTASDGGLPENWDDVKFQANAPAMLAAFPAVPTTNRAVCSVCEYAYFSASRDSLDINVILTGGGARQITGVPVPAGLVGTWEDICTE